MNPQIEGVIRSVVITAFSVAGALGYAARGIDPLVVASAIVTLAGFAWSIWSNRPKALIEQAANQPEVKAVVMTTHTEANAIPNDKVIGPSP